MWPFRRKAGRHELGAAVTGIPGLPQAAPPVAAQAATPAWTTPPTAVVALVVPPPALEAGAASPEPAAPELPPAPRVELGFRDGTTTALAPGSDQAKALSDIASVLTRRD